MKKNLKKNKTFANKIYKIRAKFSAGSRGNFLFAIALNFYNLNKK